MPRKPSKNAPAAAVTTVRQLDALELRKKGHSYQSIGDQLGISKEAAWQLVDRAMRELREAVKETATDVLHLDLSRLDDMLLAWLPAATTKPEGAPTPDDKAANVVLRTIERRSKMLGNDAPTRTELTGKNGGAIETATANANMDLSNLSTEQLALLAELLAAAEKPADDQA